jgi:hypothetical protein
LKNEGRRKDKGRREKKETKKGRMKSERNYQIWEGMNEERCRNEGGIKAVGKELGGQERSQERRKKIEENKLREKEMVKGVGKKLREKERVKGGGKEIIEEENNEE